MNIPETMYQDFQKLLPQLKEALNTGTTYATELGHRIIQWDIINTIFIIILSIIINLFFLILYKISIKNKWNYDMKDELLFCLVIFSVINFISLISFGSIIIKAIYIPEIRIIEILSNLIN